MWAGGLPARTPQDGRKQWDMEAHSSPSGAVFPHLEHPTSLVFNMCIPEVTGPLPCAGRAIPQSFIETPSDSVDTTEGPPLPAVPLVKLVTFPENTYPIGAQAKLDGQKHTPPSTSHVIEVEWRK